MHTWVQNVFFIIILFLGHYDQTLTVLHKRPDFLLKKIPELYWDTMNHQVWHTVVESMPASH